MKGAHVWRLVNHGLASYSDVMRFWDINEVMTANEWLDIKEDQEYLNEMHAKAERDARKGKRR